MGCGISKLEESDAVLQCKTRRAELQEAVKSRQDFALAHLSYLESLCSVGSALRLLAGDNGDSDPVLTLITTSLTPEGASSPPSSSPNIAPPIVPSQPHVSSSLSSSSSSPLSSTSSPPICPPSPAPLHTTKQTPPAVNSSPSLETIPPTQLPNLSTNSSMENIISMENIQTSPKSPRNSPYSGMTTRESYFSASASPTPSLPLIPTNFSHQKSEWDYFNFFEPPPVQFHLQERMAMKQVELEENRDTLNPDRDQLDEVIPALEEEDKQEDSAETEELQANNASRIDLEVSPSSEEKSLPEDDRDMISKTASELNSLVSFADDGIIKKDLSLEEEKVLTVVTTFEELNLREVARRVNDQFIRAYNSGKDVLSMLESQKVDHRSTFSSLRDSVKVLNVIKWHQPSKLALVWTDEISDNEMVEGHGIAGSHDSTLERLYAWEKKLFDEVKAGENIRLHFERKCKELQVLDAKGRDRNKIDKTRAILRNLDSQLIVALRAVNSVSQRIQIVTNDELFPQMATIIFGLAKMWRVMLECHQTQKAITLDLTSLEESSLMGEANEENWKVTVKLEHELRKFRDCFHQWVSTQRGYINAIQAWLRACHMRPEKDNKGRIVSSYPLFEPPILPLTIKWKQALKQLQPRVETVNNAIESFVSALQSLQVEQQEEINRRKKREGNNLDEELNRKINPRRYFDKNVDGDSSDRELLMVDERKSGVEKHSNKLIQERRIKSTLSSLRATLPVIFDALSAFASSCLEEYESLRQDAEKNSFHHLENSNGNLPEPFMNRY